jgi:cation diffusion facilitator family transporter
MNSFTPEARLLIMICLTASFFAVEFVAGYLTSSLALVADAFHMLGDAIALCVALKCRRLSRNRTPDKTRNTYGWQRVETVGALTNGVFLVALCFTIAIGAIQRIFQPVEITAPIAVLSVGGVGLAFNLFGMVLFAGNHGHGHSHGTGDANLHGVFLHIAADTMGSFAVIISALVMMFGKNTHRFLVDPISSLFIASLVVFVTYPLLQRCISTLLQDVPAHVDMAMVQSNIMNLAEVDSLHDLHIWELADNKAIASVHVVVNEARLAEKAQRATQAVLHAAGVHSQTIQVEICTSNNRCEAGKCLRTCAAVDPEDRSCAQHHCCAIPEDTGTRQDAIP